MFFEWGMFDFQFEILQWTFEIKNYVKKYWSTELERL